MKSTGIVRKVDELGRVVLPIELRRTMGIDIKDPVEIYVDGEHIILKKYEAQKACIITGEVTKENVEYAPGIWVSPKGAEILLPKLEKMVSQNTVKA